MKITDVCKKENCDFYIDGECDREEGFQICKDSSIKEEKPSKFGSSVK